MPLQIRRGTDAERLALTQPLAAGELVYTTDGHRLYIGDGTTMGGIGITGYTDEDARDAIGTALEAGNANNTGITFTKYDAQDKIVATLNGLSQNIALNGHNITGTGNIVISGNVKADFQGSLYADDSTNIINGYLGTVNLNNTIDDHAVPRTTNVNDLGTISKRFRELYLGTGLDIGGYAISVSGSSLNLPAGTTVGGVPIISNAGATSIKRDIQGSVFADDSTLLVDAVMGRITGPVFADVTGNVVGDVRGTLKKADGTILHSATTPYISNTILSITNSTLKSVSGVVTIDGLGDLGPGLVIQNDNTDPGIEIQQITSGINGPQVKFYAAGNSLSSPSVINVNDSIGGLRFNAFLTTTGGNQEASVASINAVLTQQGTGLLDPSARIDVTLLNGPNLANAKTYSFDAAGTFAAPAVKVGSYNGSSYYPSPAAGMIIFDSSNNHFYGYNGTQWKQLDN